MIYFLEALCHCPQCHQETHAGSSLIEVVTLKTLDGGWSRWTRCSYCHATSRQVYDFQAHRFGQAQLINRSVP